MEVAGRVPQAEVVVSNLPYAELTRVLQRGEVRKAVAPHVQTDCAKLQAQLDARGKDVNCAEREIRRELARAKAENERRLGFAAGCVVDVTCLLI